VKFQIFNFKYFIKKFIYYKNEIKRSKIVHNVTELLYPPEINNKSVIICVNWEK
jgi:hypothetical protein